MARLILEWYSHPIPILVKANENCPIVTGEAKISSDLTQPGIEPGSPGWKSDTLPRRHKSWLVQHGCMSADIRRPCDILPHQIGLRPRSPRPQRMISNQTRGITARSFRKILRWVPNVTGEENTFRHDPAGNRTQIARVEVRPPTAVP